MRGIFGAAMDTIGNIYSGVQGYFKAETQAVENKLLKQIQACSYEKQNIKTILQGIEKVQKQFPELESGLLSFNEGTAQIQLNGNIPVLYKGKTYQVKSKVYIPQAYPKQAPMIRIINLDPEHLVINTVYENGRSFNDYNSYVLINLNTFKNWNPQYFDISSLINEAITQMGKNFPFKKRGPSNLLSNGPSNTKSKQSQQKIEQPKPKSRETPTELIQYQHRCMKFIKQIQSDLCKLRQQNIEQIQNLELTNMMLNQQIPHLKLNIKQIKEFVDQKQVICSNIPLLQLVVAYGKDSILLDLITQNKTLREDIEFLERKYDRKQISFDTMLRMIRKVEEDRFGVQYALKQFMETQLI